MGNGWSTKHIHRQIVLSRAYRRQRAAHAENQKLDPENKLLWRWPLRRLEAEAIRDAALVAGGELDRTVGGISVPPERQEERPRRTIYLFQQRSEMPRVMEMFDGPGAIASCSRRAVSTVALQPLYLLNSEFMTNRAKASAAVVINSADSDIEKQIEAAFLRTLSRKPDFEEIQLAKTILQGESEVSESANERLTQLCHALMNLNEFVYIP